MARKVLMLGGANSQIPAIRRALEKGYEVLTCDNLPTNPGHRLAHRSFDVSTTDLEGVLALARREKVDGVVCYASDPAAPTAAYVCEQMGFPTNPYKAVDILCQKDKFRQFLAENGFLTPRAAGFSSLAEARPWIEGVGFPIMVKPVDSSGSKGVSMASGLGELQELIDSALKFSRCGRFILEEYVHQDGPQLCGDGFAWDGKLVFQCFGDDHLGHGVATRFASILLSMPHTRREASMTELCSEIQRAFDLLGIRMGAFNFDVRVRADGRPIIMEIGPRSGGDYTPQLIHHATGVDMVDLVIEAAMGGDCSSVAQKEPVGTWISYVVQGTAKGRFERFAIDPDFERDHLVEFHPYAKDGDVVHEFRGSHDSLGVLLARFASLDELEAYIPRLPEAIQVILKS